MTPSDRAILERAVIAISEQAVNASKVIDEATYSLPADHPVTIAAKMLRFELLKTKGELERGLSDFVLDCSACGMEVHWVQGISMSDPGHWGHRYPAPHGDPIIQPRLRSELQQGRSEDRPWSDDC